MLRAKLAQSNMLEAMICKLFIAKMPEHLINCLIIFKNATLKELTVTADQMITSSEKIQQSLFNMKTKKIVLSTEQCDEVSGQFSNKIFKLLQPSSRESSSNILTSGHMMSDSKKFKSSKTSYHPQDTLRLDQNSPKHLLVPPYIQYFGKVILSMQLGSENGPHPLQQQSKWMVTKVRYLTSLIKKTGTKYFVDTEAEMSIVHPTYSYLSFYSFRASVIYSISIHQ